MTTFCLSFFFNDTPTPEIYTLSLHDALPICVERVDLDTLLRESDVVSLHVVLTRETRHMIGSKDRKSTRLNSSHQIISYAVFCLKKKKQNTEHHCSN